MPKLNIPPNKTKFHPPPHYLLPSSPLCPGASALGCRMTCEFLPSPALLATCTSYLSNSNTSYPTIFFLPFAATFRQSGIDQRHLAGGEDGEEIPDAEGPAPRQHRVKDLTAALQWLLSSPSSQSGPELLMEVLGSPGSTPPLGASCWLVFARLIVFLFPWNLITSHEFPKAT